jgi:hypothetical protein
MMYNLSGEAFLQPGSICGLNMPDNRNHRSISISDAAITGINQIMDLADRLEGISQTDTS